MNHVTRRVSISFVVPTYRRPDALEVTLDAIVAQDYSGGALEVVVVDDSGDDATAEVVRRYRDGGVHVRYASQQNSGAATARNHGARLASGELLIFCDDDIVLESDHAQRQLATRSQLGDPIVNGTLEFSPAAKEVLRETPFGRFRIDLDRRFQADADGRHLDATYFEAPLLSACNLAVRRALFWELGGFGEDFPFAGAEDQAFSLQARAAGCQLVRDHSIRVLHNDQILTLSQFCAREERSAQTFVVLVRHFPEQASRPLYEENRFISRQDPLRRVVKKALKRVLSQRLLLNSLTVAVERVQRVPTLPEGVLRRMFESVIGLHLFRGVRTALAGAHGATASRPKM